MSASPASARHETRALLRAHLAAATSYRHLTRHCPICHQLLRLALEPSQRGSDGCEAPEAGFVRQGAVRDESDPDTPSGEKSGARSGGKPGTKSGGDESPSNA
ncbi:DUF6274 family protein [Streptomyces sp. NPDC041068]|uniref:DUF6274 family protein n=1 Tax=Streptomyces sp. NPDC041068 TaxID=3155130 RepID=UPI00340B70A4